MYFRHFDTLRAFVLIARHESFAAAADALNMTKGAVSYRIRTLEEQLGFPLFERQARGVVLSARGQELLGMAETAFRQMEDRISELSQTEPRTLTVGVSTYFASRWLSPRLMDFMRAHPDVRLRLQPMVDLSDLKGEGVDLAIRWGRGDWTDQIIEPLLDCPAWPVGNRRAAEMVSRLGLQNAFRKFTLLRDRPDSDAWSHWYEAAGLPFRSRADTLIIPDPNVRVQAVIDGQGVALNDALVARELEDGTLTRLSDIQAPGYGYFLAYPGGGLTEAATAFADWLRQVIEQGYNSGIRRV
ncbi:LysR substrate-binding domain-containing protein [Coralliovum pocilloporae]|uniref:LysR substrate-binding domain-containing protein n=1 Tax=Coralliovum pocilloporae TaxID=3066369 RepID=UPI003306CC0B